MRVEQVATCRGIPILSAPQRREGKAAFSILRDLYRADGDDDRLLGLYARQLAHDGMAAHFPQMVSQLLEVGEEVFALKLAAHAPEMTYSSSLADAAQREGWSIVPGQPTGPATSRWISAEGLISRHGGAVTLSVPSRDQTSRLYRATPGQPLHIDVAGEHALRLSLRPLMTGNEIPPDAAIRITIDGKTRRVPVLSSVISTGLVADIPGITLGTQIERRLPLPAGAQTVTIRPEGLSIAVSAEVAPGPFLVPENVSEKMSDLLQRYQNDPAAHAHLLADAAIQVERYPRDRDIARTWARFMAQSRWEGLRDFEQSAGFRTFPTRDFSPESPRLRARAALLPSLPEGTRLMPANATQAVAIYNIEPGKVRARLQLVTVPTERGTQGEVEWQIDDGPLNTMTLTAETQDVSIPVPPGDHVLRFKVTQIAPNHYATLLLTDEDGSVLAGPDRRYEVATADEPVVLAVQGPILLRVDRLTEAGTQSRLVPLPKGPQQLVLRPEAGASEGLFRVFALVPDMSSKLADETDPPDAPERMRQVRSVVRDDGLAVNGNALARPLETAMLPQDAVQMAEDGPGTWSVTAAAQRRLRTNGATGERGTDDFLELRAVYRAQLPEWDAFSRSGFLIRTRNSAPLSFGVMQNLEIRPPGSAWSFDLEAAVFAQDLGPLAWSARLNADAIWRNALSEALTQRATIGARVQHLSLSGVPTGVDAQDIDADVFSIYASQHSRALSLGYALDYRPWEDVLVTAELGLTTNEDLNPFAPDRWEFGLAALHQVGLWRFGAEARHIAYLADGDRATSSNSNRLILQVTRESWVPKGDRIQVGGRLEYRSDADKLSAGIFLSWHFGGGFDNFSPSERVFGPIRDHNRALALKEGRP